MVLEINQLSDCAEPQDIWVADRRLWLTADKSEAVEDGDPKSAFLLVAPGQSMSRARAQELGVIPQAKVESEPEEEVKEAPKSEDKQLAKPADKQRAKPVTKSRKRAKKMFTWKDVRAVLAERGVTLISAGLDEVPMAYKDIDEVMAAQADLVDPVARFQPRIVKMAPAGERPED